MFLSILPFFLVDLWIIRSTVLCLDLVLNFMSKIIFMGIFSPFYPYLVLCEFLLLNFMFKMIFTVIFFPFELMFKIIFM